jgi:hypothetical protein
MRTRGLIVTLPPRVRGRDIVGGHELPRRTRNRRDPESRSARDSETKDVGGEQESPLTAGREYSKESSMAIGWVTSQLQGRIIPTPRDIFGDYRQRTEM